MGIEAQGDRVSGFERWAGLFQRGSGLRSRIHASAGREACGSLIRWENFGENLWSGGGVVVRGADPAGLFRIRRGVGQVAPSSGWRVGATSQGWERSSCWTSTEVQGLFPRA